MAEKAPSKAEALAFRVLGDMGGALVMGLAYAGHKLGLYRAMAGARPMTSAQLAKKTQLNERYVREWAKAMVAAEYLDYDAARDRYMLDAEQASVLVDEMNELYMGGAFLFTVPCLRDVPRLLTHFRKGGGIRYDEMDADIPVAIEKFLQPGYHHHLVKDWLAAVPRLVERLRRGGRIGDVGCGRGQSTVALACAFSKAQVVGIDNDPRSIRGARALAKKNRSTNARFVVASAEDTSRHGPFDLVCSFDCIHDMVNPRGALRSIAASLARDGVHVWSEPKASANPLENRNIIGRMFQAVSPLHCMTVSLAHGGEGLGTVIGEAGARALAKEAGYGKFDVLPIDDPFNYFFALRR